MSRRSLIERVYSAIKAELTRGVYRPGERVDVMHLAEQHHTSPSPIRGSLNRLVGEGLLEARSHDGFFVPFVTESGLRDLYELSEFLLLCALEKAPVDSALPAPPVRHAIVEDTEALFNDLVQLGGNGLVSRSMASVNDRLRAIRLLPDLGVFDRDDELQDLCYACVMQDRARLVRQIRRYHHRRQELLPRIVALAYEQPRHHDTAD